MSDITIFIDGVEVKAKPGQTIMEAADAAGVYIPRLCALKDLSPYGGCRVCTVMCNGRPQTACTQPVAEGMIVENETDKIKEIRKGIIEMLFVEGNHVCPACEKSGNCELQATAYRLGIASPRFPYAFPRRQIDATHPDILIERNRCILCARCVRASSDVDRKHAFDFVGRGTHKRIAVNAEVGLGGTNAAATDKAIEVCPVGCLMKKRVGFAVPVGQRRFDQKPIGSEIEHAAGVTR